MAKGKKLRQAREQAGGETIAQKREKERVRIEARYAYYDAMGKKRISLKTTTLALTLGLLASGGLHSK